MRKEKKMLKIALFSIPLLVGILTFNVSAWGVDINESVPTAQGYKTLSASTKEKKTSVGIVKLSYQEPAAVTFSARVQKDDGKWGSYQTGTVVYKEKLNYNHDVTYGGSVDVGKIVQARFRNHNWSLNSNRIEGRFNYQ